MGKSIFSASETGEIGIINKNFQKNIYRMEDSDSQTLCLYLTRMVYVSSSLKHFETIWQISNSRWLSGQNMHDLYIVRLAFGYRQYKQSKKW